MRIAQPFFGLARHIEKAYDFIKDKLTHWVAVKKRAALYREVQHYQRRDPAKLADFLIRLDDMSTSFPDRFRRSGDEPAQPDIPEVEMKRQAPPEVSHDR